MNPELLVVDTNIYITHLGIDYLEKELREQRSRLKDLEAQRAQLLAKVHA